MRNAVGRADIVDTISGSVESSVGEVAPSDRQLRAMVVEALPADTRLIPLKGFGMNLSANPDFRKVFFSAKCDCGTAALLSVEIAQEKTINQIEQALPSLVSKLGGQSRSFYSMSCDVHRKMRLGPAKPPSVQGDSGAA